MITVGSEQFSALTDTWKRNSTRIFTEKAVDRYPLILGSRPSSHQIDIIENCFGRAARHGADWQSSLAMFAELMLGVAPNFDTHPAVMAHLAEAATRGEANQAILDLPEAIPESAWREISVQRQTLALYTPPWCLDMEEAVRIEAALTPAFAGRVEVVRAADFAGRGLELADRLGLGGVEDAAFVCAACAVVYGLRFPDGPEKLWVDRVMRSRLATPARVEALRARIAIDLGWGI